MRGINLKLSRNLQFIKYSCWIQHTTAPIYGRENKASIAAMHQHRWLNGPLWKGECSNGHFYPPKKSNFIHINGNSIVFIKILRLDNHIIVLFYFSKPSVSKVPIEYKNLFWGYRNIARNWTLVTTRWGGAHNCDRLNLLAVGPQAAQYIHIHEIESYTCILC